MTQFGYQPSLSSPAARRIIEAGQRFAKRFDPPALPIIAKEPEPAVDAPSPIPVNAAQRRRLAIMKVEVALGILRDTWERDQRAPSPSMAQILREVADKHGLPVAALRDPGRRNVVVVARHEAFYRCIKETTHSTTAIARWFHRDHTTVIYGARAHEARMQRGESNG